MVFRSAILDLRGLEKEEQNKSKVNGSREIIKIQKETNKLENRKTVKKINETKIWLLEKINKTEKPLARQTKKKQRRLKLLKLKMKV